VISFEQLAATPTAALTALQALRDEGAIKPGQKVLINGASGGVGTFAVQLAKHFGAEVTAVCSTRNMGLVRSLGADHVIDYTKDSYIAGAERYDLILDNVTNHALGDNIRMLKVSGVYVGIGGGGPDAGNWVGQLGRPIRALLMSPFVRPKVVTLFAETDTADLLFIAELMAQNKLRSVIDRRYPLEEVPAAMEYLETGRARGKVIIAVVDQVER
jgi:NADPH:quinone reductase-like Zn-dependent oxidoreductase